MEQSLGFASSSMQGVDEARLAALDAQHKNAERNPSLVLRVKQTSTEVDENDPYAAFRIPDDLMW